jgi:hypothetical protein
MSGYVMRGPSIFWLTVKLYREIVSELNFFVPVELSRPFVDQPGGRERTGLGW